MHTPNASDQGRERPTFYTVAEAARVLRVDPATIYRAIRADAFPAVRVRSRYVIPVAAVNQMAEQAADTGTCVDVAASATHGGSGARSRGRWAVSDELQRAGLA